MTVPIRNRSRLPYRKFGNDAVGAVLLEVYDEFMRAATAHPPMNSPHEAYAVCKEELDEAWDEIKVRHPDINRIRGELKQLAAMAIRAMVDVT